MKLVSWNVNGLRAVLGKGFLDYVAAENPDVICLQETKMRPEQAEFDLPGYHRFWNSADKAGYSGTAIFTKKEPLNVTYDFGIDEHRHEGRIITAEYEGQKATCTVRCRFENPAPTEKPEEEQKDAAWKASHSDVSISVGETFRLTVKNSAGETADAIWTMSIDGVVSMDGSTITGRAPGEVTLTTTVDGVTMTCIVRVK